MMSWMYKNSKNEWNMRKEGEMENKDTHATNTFFMTLEPCAYMHTHEDSADVRRQAVQQKKCACNK